MKSLPKILIIAAAVGAFGYGGTGVFFSMNATHHGGSHGGPHSALWVPADQTASSYPKKKAFFKNFMTKIPVVAVIGAILWFGSGHFGFPYLVADQVCVFLHGWHDRLYHS